MTQPAADLVEHVADLRGIIDVARGQSRRGKGIAGRSEIATVSTRPGRRRLLRSGGTAGLVALPVAPAQQLDEALLGSVQCRHLQERRRARRTAWWRGG
jgi:hypothetical protein